MPSRPVCGGRWKNIRPLGCRGSIRWRSPLRGPWLTSVFGSVLLVVLPIVILTGLVSYIAYGPAFGQAIPADVGGLTLPTFDWPTDPAWLYRLTRGLHVGLGLIVIPRCWPNYGLSSRGCSLGGGE